MAPPTSHSMGTINEDAISNLSLAAELTKNIEMTISPGQDKADLISMITPKLIWTVKDFMLELPQAKTAGTILKGDDAAAAARELARLLREQAKVV